MTVHAFLGPSLSGQDATRVLPGLVVHPPAAHGDLLRLDCAAGDVVVLVDGYYHHSAPVRHKEILALLTDGVHVVGCASMGALRAAELHEFGMVGNGTVFEMYRDGVIGSDDEVSVTHTEAPEYRKLTVASVAVRHAIDCLETLTAEEKRALVGIVRNLPYTGRSWQAIAAAAEHQGVGAAFARLRSFMADRPDVKALDTIDTLSKIARHELPGMRETGEWERSQEWCTRFIAEWRTEFSVTTVEDIEVGAGAVVRYQQIYRDDFPARWEELVLTKIGGPGDGLVRRALAEAARQGLTAESVTEAQAAYWLTPAERSALSHDDMVLRLLVRSYPTPTPTHDIAESLPDVASDPAARRAVAEAHVTNARIAARQNAQSIAHLKRDVLRRHLADVWLVDGQDEAALTVAARDRGFASLNKAVSAVRPFFLRSLLLAPKAG